MRLERARIGVVGCGWWATHYHIPALLEYEGAELAGLADTDPDRLQAAADFYSVPQRFQDHRDLFASKGLQGVIIATPHATHYKLALAALHAGLHVLVEKPMVLNSREAWGLIGVAESKKLHLGVGYTYQHTRAARRCRALIRSGGIGDLHCVSCLFSSMVEAYYRGRPEEYRDHFQFPVTGPLSDTYSDPARAGGGQAQTQMTHAMGMVFHVTGERAVEVCAYMRRGDLRVDLADAVSYRLESGAVGTATSTGSLRPGQPSQQELRYYGSQGFILQDLLGGTLSAHFNDGAREELVLDEEEIYPAGAPARNLADLITGRAENLAPSRPAARTVEFLEAAYRSTHTGSSIAIPLEPDLMQWQESSV